MSPPPEDRVIQKIPVPKMVSGAPMPSERVRINKPDLLRVGKAPERKFEPGKKPGVNALKKPLATDRVISERKVNAKSEVQDVLDLPDSPRVTAEKMKEQKQAQIYST